MASDLNARLAAILERNPKLKVSHEDWTLVRSGTWWTLEREHKVPAGPVTDAFAHALIFRAMVENVIARGGSLQPYVGTRVAVGGRGGWDISDTALDALCAYYEGAAHAG